MKTTFVSTLSLSSTLRGQMLKAQANLIDAEKEVTTGRYADVGVSIGVRTGTTVGLRQQFERLSGITDTNALLTSRLDSSQEAMKGMLDTAQDFLSQLISVRSNPEGGGVLAPQATNNLQSIIATLNTSMNGQYLFGGINTQQRPIADYFGTPAPASKTTVDTAFATYFGFAQDDPAAEAITPADMKTFLETTFRDGFDDPAWGANWSTAADKNITGRISTTEVVEVGTNANGQHFRDLARAYTMIVDAGGPRLSGATFQALTDEAIETISAAIQGITADMAKLGNVQERVKVASERLSIQRDIIAKQVNAYEGVDQYEASTRLTQLTTQIETAYALTARIQNLSILNYMR